jgi:mannose-1-phosphate guanylyltransferase
MKQSARFHAWILAGGRGTRFWPRSRKSKAKQVLEFLGRGTLIQQTVERLSPAIPPERIWVLTNDALRDEIVRQLPQVPKRQIIAESAGRNTAPAVGLAAHILSSVDPEAVMGIFPADHFIGKPAAFRSLVRAAYKSAAAGRMVLLGIQPRWPETGYGYVEFPEGAMKPGSGTPIPVLRFREKPDLETARQFLASGNFGWNAGMFFWRVDVIQDAMRRHMPRTAALLDSLPKFGSRGFGAALAATYPKCESISVDYAVLEKADGVQGFAAGDIGWNDVGSWNAVFELLPRDKQGNAARGAALIERSSGNYIDAPGKLVALLGVDDLVIVDTPDALLVTRRELAQQVGDLVKRLEKEGRDSLL